MAHSPSPHYFAYLLRLWPSSDQSGSVWRAHLENPRTGERYGFANLKALVVFLEQVTGERLLEDEEKDGGKHKTDVNEE